MFCRISNHTDSHTVFLRAIAGLFSVAHDMSRGSQDPNFPRLGQMLVEYDHALKKISEDFVPLAKVCTVYGVVCVF